jgi:hypothetical protein
MIEFSEALETTLHRSLEYANERHHEFASLEHLLLGLVDDQDAADVMIASGVDLTSLRARVTKYLDEELEASVVKGSAEAQPTTGFQRVIHRAVVHVQSSGRRVVTGANVLSAIFAERESHAALFLMEQGMTRFDAVQYMSHGIAKRPEMSKASNVARTVVALQDRIVVARKIFISYRRDDSAGYAGRIHDRLEKEFGRDLLFMDVDAIPLGVDFVKFLKDAVAQADVMLAIIGQDWLDACDEGGRRRLDNPRDFVRIEIGAALQRDIPVIPIFVDGARIYKPEELPDDLKELTFRNGLDVRHSSFHSDMDRLVKSLNSRLGRVG